MHVVSIRFASSARSENHSSRLSQCTPTCGDTPVLVAQQWLLRARLRRAVDYCAFMALLLNIAVREEKEDNYYM